MRISKLALLSCVALGFGSVACDKDDDDKTVAPEVIEESGSNDDLNLVGTISNSDSFSTLLAAVEIAGLTDVLLEGEYTIFAPSNEAFAKIPQADLEALLADKEALTEVLLLHVVPGVFDANQVLQSVSLSSAAGQDLMISTRDGLPFVNDSQIVKTDLQASNGIIHVIDTVILPKADVSPIGDIVSVATAAGNFNTLLEALEAAGLSDVLKGEGPYTVFAPTDEAFAKIPAETLQALLGDKETLSQILLYHVVPGVKDAATVLQSSSLTTANSLELTVKQEGGTAYINDSQITATDISALNGVIHVIDTVLIP